MFFKQIYGWYCQLSTLYQLYKKHWQKDKPEKIKVPEKAIKYVIEVEPTSSESDRILLDYYDDDTFLKTSQYNIY